MKDALTETGPVVQDAPAGPPGRPPRRDGWGRLGALVWHHPWAVVVTWLVLAAVGFSVGSLGVLGSTLQAKTESVGGLAPSSESMQAWELLTDDSSGYTTLATLSGVDLTDRHVQQVLATELAATRQQIAALPHVAAVTDPFTTPEGPADPAVASLLASDGRGVIVMVEPQPDLTENQGRALDTAARAALDDLVDRVTTALPGADGAVGSRWALWDEHDAMMTSELTRGEMISLPLALGVMILVFSGVLAAGMPLVGALTTIACAFGVMYGLAPLTFFHSSAVNVVTVLALGVSIDYGLLVVSRYREEMTRHEALADAMVAALRTAGRTVVFSALTVAVAVSGLLLFPTPILQGYGLAALVGIVIAMSTAVTLVPALLRLAGERIRRTSPVLRIPGVRWAHRLLGDTPPEHGVFSRLARHVQRRPWWVMGGVFVALLVVASPVLGLRTQAEGIETLPDGSPSKHFFVDTAEQFPALQSSDLLVVSTQATLDQAQQWAAAVVTDQPAVVAAYASAGDGYVRVSVHLGSAYQRQQDQESTLAALRADDTLPGALVTGDAAAVVDFEQEVLQRVWWVVLFIAITTFGLLLFMTRSVLIPLKALVTNGLTLLATLGVLVWVFQDRHLAGVLGIIPADGLEAYMLPMLLLFGFGLAMDYEVFLVSRIKEAYDAGADNDDAVAVGMQRSGRIITSAALVMALVFTGFALGRILTIKELGAGMAIAVLVDAIVVRMLLVPATMTVLGRWNWWLPGPLRRLLPARAPE
ncbi:MAG: MMPL family transporter [Micrococcales bacterium]|nr:MMPL family transporter [Micrococcales bacterium]